uniref:DNA pilot protein n=1 Tax=Dulem virus 163 TaxID=3145640 RepID=A0AAU8B1H3_9VIRU
MATSARGVSQDVNGRSNPNWSGHSTGSVSAGSSSYDSALSQIMQNTSNNNAWSAEQAAIQRDWQVQQNQAAMQFNMQEAAKNRDWQEYMSSTAHQREIKDLKAAGLNPILSAMGGNGAAVTSGATASGVTSAGSKGDTDTSANGAIVALLGSFLTAQTRLQEMNTNAITNLAVADKYNAMQKYTADLGAQTQLTTTNINAATSRWIAQLQSQTNISTAQISAAAQKVSAQLHAGAAMYGADVSSWTQQEVARINGTINKELKQMGIKSDFSMKYYFPSNAFESSSAVRESLHDMGINPFGSGLEGILKDVLTPVKGSVRGSGFKK